MAKKVQVEEEQDLAAPHSPFYNQPEDADRYPVAVVIPPAHEVQKGNPEIDGPYLDDIREAEADARRKMTEKKQAAAEKKANKEQIKAKEAQLRLIKEESEENAEA